MSPDREPTTTDSNVKYSTYKKTELKCATFKVNQLIGKRSSSDQRETKEESAVVAMGSRKRETGEASKRILEDMCTNSIQGSYLAHDCNSTIPTLYVT